MRIIVLLMSFISLNAGAAVFNKTGRALNLCEMRAVYFGANNNDFYVEGGADADLVEVKETNRFGDRVEYRLKFEQAEVEVFTVLAFASIHDKGFCALPEHSRPIVQNVPSFPQMSKCVAESAMDLAMSCNESLSYFTESLSYKEHQSINKGRPDINGIFIERAAQQLVPFNKKFSDPMVVSGQSSQGDFTVELVEQPFSGLRYVAVRWIDVDVKSDSYTVFFSAEFPNEFIYSYNEN
ncbi:MAG: hypothetical protein AAF203_00120 [Pseudomonadota bacterium]